jgi:hypothetical protein
MMNANEDSLGSDPMAIALCCLVVILALVVGVGLASNLVLRHLVQTLPLWFGVAFGFRRGRATGWIALPFFLFWLALMIVIWLYLLGIGHIISGHFSAVEKAMIVIVGGASLIGIVLFARLKSFLSPAKAAAAFVAMALLQLACFRLSFLPAIARR